MPKLTRMSGKDIIAQLEKRGFVRIRQKGSHVILKRETGDATAMCVIPLHDELAVGTIRGILRQARISPEEFMND